MKKGVLSIGAIILIILVLIIIYFYLKSIGVLPS